jgi:3-hydroxy-9,10-secoandrosta-1,3,5(10)-triene-9,17-dione monooxygenase
MEPSGDILLDRARAIASDLPGRIGQANAARDLPPDTISALHEADLFRLLKPRRYGGFECNPALFYDVQNVLAEKCLSSAWVFGVLSIQSFVLSLFPAEAQEDVWGSDPATLASSSFAPSGTVERAPGGYRISGQWGWSSGSSYAQWGLVGGLIPPDAPGAPPEMRLFLVPRADYTIIDTWHSFGLRGTGSNDLRIEGAFVPEYRALRPAPPLAMSTDPGRPPIYRLPWLFMFASCVSNLALGGGRGAVQAVARLRSEQPGGGDEAGRLTLARAHGAIEAANLALQHNIHALWNAALRCEALPDAQILLYRSQMAEMLRNIAGHVDDLMLLTGGRGMREGGPITQTWLDLQAARHHMGNIPDGPELALAACLVSGC